jgi:photosystem II stability/assembly factor-like uncharacterized protein
MVSKKFLLYPLSVFLLFNIEAKAQSITNLQQGKRTSIRGLSVVDDSVAWISGSRGNIAITKDGGKNWIWQQVKGFEQSDFRYIEAFSDKKAIIMSSGTPALILKTVDGGSTWQVKYRNVDTAYFLDAMDFDSPEHGLILGDPIKGKFLLIETVNAGEDWHLFKDQPTASAGEAAFAASGTCLRVDKGEINIVTGGTVSRILISKIKNPAWASIDLPIAHGVSSKGAFSIADKAIVVGGNYSKDKVTDSVACRLGFKKGKFLTELIARGPLGYQSCVELIGKKMFLSTGTSGTNLSADGGNTWHNIDDKSYNVCRKARSGKLVLLAGDGGKIAVFNYK